MSDVQDNPAIEISVQAHEEGVAKAIGKVIASALVDTGFVDVKVNHIDLVDGGPDTPDVDFEQGKSMLEAISQANPTVFQQSVSVWTSVNDPIQVGSSDPEDIIAEMREGTVED